MESGRGSMRSWSRSMRRVSHARPVAEYRQLGRAFRVSLILKGADALLEVVGGLLFLLVPPSALGRIVTALTQHELSEDPNDLVASFLRNTAQHFGSARSFGAVYLLSHGLRSSWSSRSSAVGFGHTLRCWCSWAPSSSTRAIAWSTRSRWACSLSRSSIRSSSGSPGENTAGSASASPCQASEQPCLTIGQRDLLRANRGFQCRVGWVRTVPALNLQIRRPPCRA